MRTAKLRRTTGETDVAVVLDLDGTGKSEISTGCGFLDHMLTLFARHGRFDLTVQAKGDTWVDDHHTVEDVGITLGDAFAKALGDKRGVTRYGSTILPMDEALILTAVDLSGRGLLCYDLAIPTEKVGTFDTQLAGEFFAAFARRADLTLHVKQLAGANSHHIIEGAFKSLARSLRTAVAIDPAAAGEVPSTKGVL
ncbi:imidazoleglycerol-phosphate dehydratase HisB [Allofournierella sp.]|uniref:imidazoleglycerol-phosphate dehydratase HisB n=1 Tax=Allofournierella sp. TaxID=1940256 RepID=UPI002E78D6DE|nr:imidazoleglycerol-phosphate dehydratase HisB [Fournierella sp.]MEE0756383.1 imidazoleglycerol-phosphate dehydratase HisB [Fournierella sp.]